MDQPELSTLRNLILQARESLTGVESRELLDAAVALADGLLAKGPAALLGAKGGRATAKHMKQKDPNYYARIGGMRKKRAGGRPRKTPGVS